uniref:Repressor LexA n=1 Tax=Candidatus Kentrum sp. FM TaxID=2126340 RepID=A0A450WB41_9GAMM|nr:MAG: repressor LexA [Candidatus Kentron sp. FM]VFJ62469.1 MAG: repressor LexA [Candidatus Kentron sp. FM]VFK14228.1 MAG: repressor LexA [Candidatus Kentron sp. FM]
MAKKRTGVKKTEPAYTPKQGQYLAFIHHYQKLHGVAPAQADIQKYFKVTPPTVHGMLLKLEEKRYIRRQPGVARSIEILLPEKDIPDLK